MTSTILFYLLSTISIVFALGVLFNPNPIFSALYLVLTMIGMSLMFFNLEAYFIGGVQLIVYAGAVTVLFVMVLMLFDLKKEKQAFTKGLFSSLLKYFSAGALLFMISGASLMSMGLMSQSTESPEPITVKQLSALLFTDYFFAFEVLGVVLLVVAIGAVTISRIRGGTHAK